MITIELEIVRDGDAYFGMLPKQYAYFSACYTVRESLLMSCLVICLF